MAGWAGGRTWITPSTLLQRGNLFRDVMFPDVKGFRPPDRAMSATDTRVGERLAQGMNITEATREGDAESNKMVDRDEDYNTRYGGYAGNLLAFKRTKLIPRQPAAIDLTAMVDGGARRYRRRRSSITSSIASCACRSPTRTARSSSTSSRDRLGTSAFGRARRWRRRFGSCSIWC